MDSCDSTGRSTSYGAKNKMIRQEQSAMKFCQAAFYLDYLLDTVYLKSYTSQPVTC